MIARKTLFNIAGFVFLGLGFVGMALPLLPTTIFWIFAAWLFAKSHPEMQRKIYQWPKVGPVVEAFLEHGKISRVAKKTAILGIILVGGLSLYFSTLSTMYIFGVIALLAAVIVYILMRPE